MDLAQSELGLGPHVAHGPQGGGLAAVESDSQGVGEREGTVVCIEAIKPSLCRQESSRSHSAYRSQLIQNWRNNPLGLGQVEVVEHPRVEVVVEVDRSLPHRVDAAADVRSRRNFSRN